MPHANLKPSTVRHFAEPYYVCKCYGHPHVVVVIIIIINKNSEAYLDWLHLA